MRSLFFRISFAASLLMISTAHAASGPAVSDPVREIFLREAYYHFFLSDYLDSATRLKLIGDRGIGPDDRKTDADVRSLLGSIYFSWGMDRTARGVFAELASGLPEGPDRDRLLYRVERFEYGRGLFNHAAESFRALSPDPGFPEVDHARYMAGMSYRSLGSLNEGIEVLRTVSSASPYYPFSRYAIAQSQAGLKNDEEAIRTLQKLGGAKTGKDPVLASFRDKSLLTLGMLYLERGDFDSAAETLSGIAENSVFRPEALYGRGWARFNSGMTEAALLDFEELIRTAPDHPYAIEALSIRGNCYARLKANRAALTSYQAAMDAYGSEAGAYREVRTWAGDTVRFRGWLDGTDEESAPGALSRLMDENLRFRVNQYRELAALEEYFNRKLADMEVFELILKHRDAVYESRLPDVRKFLEGRTVERLKEKGTALQSDFMESVQAESGLVGLLLKEELDAIGEIERARVKAARLREAVQKLPSGPGPDADGLEKQLSSIERWLGILRGEILWSAITELPARSDDADRQVSTLTGNLEKLEREKDRLIRSVAEMRERLSGFREALPRLAESLRNQRDRAAGIRGKLVEPLRSRVIAAIDQRLGYYDRLTAYARFGQIQVMDIEKE